MFCRTLYPECMYIISMTFCVREVKGKVMNKMQFMKGLVSCIG